MATSANGASFWRDWWKQLTVGIVTVGMIALGNLLFSIQNKKNAEQDLVDKDIYRVIDKEVNAIRQENDRQTRLIEELRNIQSERKDNSPKISKLEDRLSDLARDVYSIKRGIVGP